jgi:type I restriction enzyme, S subunit
MLHRHRLKVGDIIIARRGELSRASAITDLEKSWICGTGCFLLRLGGSNLDARFFSLAYRHDLVQRQVSGLAVGTTMASLNNSVMSALYFPHVKIDEQNRISARIEIVEHEIETLNGDKGKNLQNKNLASCTTSSLAKSPSPSANRKAQAQQKPGTISNQLIQLIEK